MPILINPYCVFLSFLHWNWQKSKFKKFWIFRIYKSKDFVTSILDQIDILTIQFQKGQESHLDNSFSNGSNSNVFISGGSGSDFFGFGLSQGPLFRVRVHRVCYLKPLSGSGLIGSGFRVSRVEKIANFYRFFYNNFAKINFPYSKSFIMLQKCPTYDFKRG